MLSMAEVAEARNSVFFGSIRPYSARIGDRPVEAVARSATRITPETYSGVAVEAMEKVDSVRSVAEPSRIPDSTPRSSAVGTITSITASISQPVAASFSPSESATGFLKKVE
jgi:hypothetical protein